MLFVQCVKMFAVPPNGEDFRALMVRALSEPWGRTNDLAPVAARLVRQDDTIEGASERAVAAQPRRLAIDELLGLSGLAELARHRLLRCLMETATVADVELERFLTALRPALLGLVSGGSAPVDDAVRDLCCSLARQCFLNEQVFGCSEEEIARASDERGAVVAALASNGEIAEPRLAMVACCFPLHSLPGAERLLAGIGLRRSPTC